MKNNKTTKKRYHSCEFCGQHGSKANVESVIDPYKSELEGIDEWVFLCDACLAARNADI